MDYIVNTLSNLLQQTAFLNLTGGNLVMIAVACFFLYLAIGKIICPSKLGFTDQNNNVIPYGYDMKIQIKRF